MSYVRRVLLVVGALAFAGFAASAAVAEAPERRGRPEIVGTYHRLAKDVVEPNGTLRDVYEDRLVSGTRSYRLKLPRGVRLQPGTPVRVTGTLAGADMTADEVETLAPATLPPATGTTKVLVILVHWGSPDAVTPAQAAAQVFGDDDGWFGEASYDQLGLTGDAIGWYQITAPTGGHCYANHMQIMDRAKAKALAAGYDPATYGRTMVYFPMCGGDASGAAGWAYQPGNTVWLNGYFDRRVSVHEQGHNYGLAHAHTYHCEDPDTGLKITLGGTCYHNDYGDEYDAMGASMYAAHFSAPAKDQIGWLVGRKRVLTGSATTFTLPPFEVAGATPLAAVVGATGETHKYWIEYRQPVGYDSALPTGATGGVLVHMQDDDLLDAWDDGAFLLDVTPADEFSDAVIPPGGAWTSPEGVRIAVGAVSPSGAEVTVTGGAQPPTVPSAPRNLAAAPGDGTVTLTWDPPLSNGGATVESYVVTRTPGGSTPVEGGATGTTVADLANGTSYSFTVAARNAVGTGPASAPADAVPTAQVPTAAITSPVTGATVGGTVQVAVTATPNAVTQLPVDYVELLVDGMSVDWDTDAPYTFALDTTMLADGPHTLTAVAYDSAWRAGESAPVEIVVAAARPTVTITKPADGTVVTDDLVTLEATAAPAPGGAAIDYVEYRLSDGTLVGYGGAVAPFTATWNTAGRSGPVELVAKVYDVTGLVGTSAPVHLTLDHAVPTVELTAPADNAVVSGDAVAVSAAATPSPLSGAAIERVEFVADGFESIGVDYDAPYGVTWDVSMLSGPHTLTAVAYDVDGGTGTSTTRTVTVDNPLPNVAVTSPSPDQVVSGVVTLAADASPSAISGKAITRVDFTVDGTFVASVGAPGPYTVPWNSAGLAGEHTLTATAYDTARQWAESSVTFTVPTPTPTAVVTAPAGGSTVRAGAVAISVASSPDVVTGAEVTEAQFFADGQLVAYDDTPENGTFTAAWNATPGSHVLTAVVYDTDRYSGTSSPVTVTVANPPAAPTNVVATAGGDGTATVTWTAPTSDGGSPIGGYVVRTGGTSQVAAGTSHVFTGLTNGTTYAFTVAATNAVGTGPTSTASNAVVPGTRVSLSVAVSPTTVVYGKSVTVTGYLKRVDTGAGVTGRNVQLLACAPGTLTCSVAKTTATTTGGKVTFSYLPRLHRDLRLRFVASSPYFATQTAAKRVKVKAYLTSAISKTSMPLGSTVTVSGRVAPAHAGRRVYLQRLTSTGWKSGPYYTLGSTGVASFAVKPTARGTYSYRLYFAGDTDHLANYSPARSVRVY